jgi:GTPase involved in cell partitioning and DNA repair
VIRCLKFNIYKALEAKWSCFTNYCCSRYIDLEIKAFLCSNYDLHNNICDIFVCGSRCGRCVGVGGMGGMGGVWFAKQQSRAQAAKAAKACAGGATVDVAAALATVAQAARLPGSKKSTFITYVARGIFICI